MGTLFYAIGLGIMLGIFDYLENDWIEFLEKSDYIAIEEEKTYKKLHRKQGKTWFSVPFFITKVQKYL